MMKIKANLRRRGLAFATAAVMAVGMMPVTVGAAVNSLTAVKKSVVYEEGLEERNLEEIGVDVDLTYDEITKENFELVFTLNGDQSSKFFLVENPSASGKSSDAEPDGKPEIVLNTSGQSLLALESSTTPSGLKVTITSGSGINVRGTVWLGVKSVSTLAEDDEAEINIKESSSMMGNEAVSIIITSSETITGKVMTWKGGSKQDLGDAVISVTSLKTGENLGSVKSAADGTYKFTVPDGKESTKGYSLTATSNFILSRVLLNEDESAVAKTSTRKLAAGVKKADFTFADPLMARGTIRDEETNSVISGANVSSWDSINSNSTGTFTVQTSAANEGRQNVYVYVSANGYYYGNFAQQVDVNADRLKEGYIDFGDLKLTPQKTGGSYPSSKAVGNATYRNRLIVVPNVVAPNELSQATLSVYADPAYNSSTRRVTIRLTSEDHLGAFSAVGTDAKKIIVTKNGTQVSAAIGSLKNSNGTLEFTINIEPGAQYQFAIGVKAPNGGTDYSVKAIVVDNTVIDGPSFTVGKATVVLQSLSIVVPPEVRPDEKFVVYGDVISSSAPVLAIYDPAGNEIGTGGAIGEVASSGWFYKFTNASVSRADATDNSVDPPVLKAGLYKAVVTAGSVTAEQEFRVTDNPIKITAMSLKDDFNTVSKTNPNAGEFLTFTGWVDGNQNSMDWRNLFGSVTLNNGDKDIAKDVEGAQFILKTSVGAYWRPDGSLIENANGVYSTYLDQYRGTGKAEVLFEVTRKDGTVLTFYIGRLIILIDPSGYVYDLKTGKRIEGAEVTLHYIDESGNDDVWPAEDYFQVNPQKTDKDGNYGFMVGEGNYYITVEAPGYSPSYYAYDSRVDEGGKYNNARAAVGPYMTVLPEQLGINLGLNPIGYAAPVTPTPTPYPYIPNGSSGSAPSVSIGSVVVAPGTTTLPSVAYTTASISSINSAFPFLAGLLYDMGLFVGVGTGADGKPNFDLNRSTNRAESLVLVLRLMGLEKAALAYTGSNPFTDVPDWAARYTAYAYSAGITFGIDDAHTKFAADRPVTQQEFTAFMLRVLGHTEKNGDFVYANAVQKAVSTGLYNADEARLIGAQQNFLRGYAVITMANALMLTPKGASTTLVDQLAAKGAVTTVQVSTYKTTLPKVYIH